MVYNMKFEYKSIFLGIALGAYGVFAILFLIDNVETALSYSTGDKNQNKNQLKYFKPNSYSENSVNYYSLIHFGEYALLGLIKSVKVWHFWIISIGWEIIELFTPYEWARESWLNKLFDIGFNFSGFYIVRKYFKNGVTL